MICLRSNNDRRRIDGRDSPSTTHGSSRSAKQTYPLQSWSDSTIDWMRPSALRTGISTAWASTRRLADLNSVRSRTLGERGSSRKIAPSCLQARKRSYENPNCGRIFSRNFSGCFGHSAPSRAGSCARSRTITRRLTRAPQRPSNPRAPRPALAVGTQDVRCPRMSPDVPSAAAATSCRTSEPRPANDLRTAAPLRRK